MRHVRGCALALILASVASAADGYQAGAQQPMLGVEMSPPPSNVQVEQGLSANQGTYVRQVFNETAAAAMGIKPGDVIMSVNGQPISSMTDLRNEVGAQTVGEPVAVVVRRNGQDVALQSTLREWPKSIPREPIDAAAEQRFRDWQQRRLARNRGDVQDLAGQVAQLRDQLARAKDAPASPFTGAPALRDAERLLRFMPAWKIAYRYDTTAIRAAPGPAPVAAAADADAEPWRLRVELSASRPPERPILREL